MKKKLLIFIPLIIISLIVFVLSYAPTYLNNYINEHGKELSNRKINIENLDFNLFTGKVRIINFKMYEDNDTTVFVKFDTLFVHLNLIKLLSNEIYIKEIKLSEPSVSLYLENKNFNFQSLVRTDTTVTENEPKDTTSTPLTFSLNNLNIISGKFNYSDLDSKIYHKIDSLDLRVKHIAFDNTTAKIGLEFKLVRGGKIATRIAYDTQNNTYNLDVNINDLDLKEFLPYLQKNVNIQDMQGRLYTNLNIEGNTASPEEPMIKGTIGVNDFKLTDNKNLEFFNFSEIRIKSDELNLKDMNFVVDTLLVDNVNANLELYKNSSSIDRLFKDHTKDVVKDRVDKVEEIADSLKEGKEINWKINHLVLKNSKASLIDYSLKPDKFSYSISNIYLGADDIKFGNDVRFIFKSTTPRGGKINADITTDPGKPGNGTFNLYTKNVDTRNLSPFFVNYFAYPIERGKFNFSFRSKIKDRYIDSRVIIDMFHFKLGEKRKNVKPQSSLPIKTALVIASDKNNRINFDVTADGDIDDPNFKIGKIVFNTIMKNLAKIIASPGRLISKSIGVDEDEIKYVEFEKVQYRLGPSQLTQLDIIAELLANKNPLSAKIDLYVDKDDEIVETAIRQAKIKFFLQNKYDDDEAFSKFTDDDNLAIDDIETDNNKFGRYLKIKTSENNLSNKQMCLKMFTPKEINDLYSQLNKDRIKNIKDYLGNKEGIIFNIDENIVNQKSVDKPYAKFNYFVEGEEQEMNLENTEK